ncbi:MAG: hypothetical protein EPGJADBJ_04442 [Saprospiraceae bacterium]|nr:hypothetical protein [Saprospiraceae bacterium]
MKTQTVFAILALLFAAVTSNAQPWLNEAEAPYNYHDQTPTIYELSRLDADDAAPKFWPVRIIIENPGKAGFFYDALGFGSLLAGAYLRGKAEHHRMYHGTSGNFDNFHVTRDAGLIFTGIGAASLGVATACNARDGKGKFWLRTLNRTAFALLFSRIVSEGTYNSMPRNY